jgi:hypothetical protein
VIHGDLAVPLMVFGLVTFAKVKLHPPSVIMRSPLHRAMTCLNLVAEVAILGGGMWMWGAHQLALWVLYNKKQFGNVLSYM